MSCANRRGSTSSIRTSMVSTGWPRAFQGSAHHHTPWSSRPGAPARAVEPLPGTAHHLDQRGATTAGKRTAPQLDCHDPPRTELGTYLPARRRRGRVLGIRGTDLSRKGSRDGDARCHPSRPPLEDRGQGRPCGRGLLQTIGSPLPDHPLIEWLGEIDELAKVELLAGARALLMPINWEEPFGLSFIEALASGTPVIARPRGSLPEIVVHGLHGFLRRNGR